MAVYASLNRNSHRDMVDQSGNILSKKYILADYRLSHSIVSGGGVTLPREQWASNPIYSLTVYIRMAFHLTSFHVLEIHVKAKSNKARSSRLRIRGSL